MGQQQILKRMDEIHQAQSATDAPEIERLQAECASHGHQFVSQGMYPAFRSCAFCYASEHPITSLIVLED